MMPTTSEAIIQCFLMSMGGFGGVWSSLESTNHSIIGKVTFFKKKVLICTPRTTAELRLCTEYHSSKLRQPCECTML